MTFHRNPSFTTGRPRAWGTIAAVLLLVLSITRSVCAQGTQAEMDLVKTRIVDSQSTGIASSSTIQGYMTSQLPDGSWADINYASSSQTAWPPRTHLDRMKAMAKMYVFGAMQGDIALRDAIFLALDAWTSRDPQSTNWWYQEISTPKYFGEILLLMENEVSAARLAAGVALIARSYQPRSVNTGTNTGANRVDRSYGTMMRGLLTNDSALTSEAFLSMGDTILINSAATFAEGIQPDFTFQQHGEQLYIGGYGTVYAQGLLKYVSFGADTSFGFTNRQLRSLLDFLLDGAQWFVRGDTIEYTAVGRSVSRAGGDAAALGFKNMMVNAIAACNGYRLAELEAFQQRLADVTANGQAQPSNALTGNRNFWFSDATVHHRPDFSISVKTSSTRTQQPESGNGEGLKNLHLADGVTLIQRTGNEYDEIMPVWDWRRLPGTTIEQGSYSLQPTSNWGVYGTSAFAGGVSDGVDGTTVFDYSRLGVAVKKSWFFLGDVMIALGTDINAPSASNPVLTTLNQSLLTGAVTYNTGGGTSTLSGTASPSALQWVHHDGTGYFFPAAANNAEIAGVAQNGSWYSINTSQSASSINRNVFSLQLNHGTTVSGASYAYLVAPGLDAAAMDAFPLADYDILRNDGTVQAVKHIPTETLAATFRAAGAVDGLSCDAKAAVLLKKDADFIDLSISDPTQINTGDITIELAVPVAGMIHCDTGITVEQTTPTLRLRVAAASSYGRTFKARFYLREHAFKTITLSPVADAFVHDGNPAANYGTFTSLTCKLITANNSYTRESFLRFDLTGLDQTPVAASLRMSPVTVSTAGLHTVHPIADNTWTESGITWDSRPFPSAAATSTWLPVLSTRTSSDILSAVLDREGSSLNLSVTAFSPTSDGFVSYASRETPVESLRPTLELVLSRPELDIWRIQHFGTETNSGDAADLFDPNVDGEMNLYEFATGQDPWAATRAAIALHSITGSSGIVTYTRSKVALMDGINFTVEWKNSLTTGTWSSAGIIDQNPAPVAEDLQSETLEIIVPTDSETRFFRLNVLQP